MTPEREAKHVERAIRAIALDAIAPAIIAQEEEVRGLWCLIGNQLQFVRESGVHGEWTLDDPLECAQMVRWVRAQKERVHPTLEAALAFVRSKLSN